MQDPDIIYRPPFEAFSPLLEMTRGCTHNACRFCTMYKTQPFAVLPLEIFERNLEELAECVSNEKHIYCTGGNPFALSAAKLEERFLLIRRYLPAVREITMNARVTDVCDKSVSELRRLHELGLTMLYIGQESGNDATLALINKGYDAEEILRQCYKLEEAGIGYVSTFLNGVTDRSLSRQHTLESARVFNVLHQEMVAIASFTMFPGTPLAEDIAAGHVTLVSEKEALEELLLFLEALEIDAEVFTAKTLPLQLKGRLPEDKPAMLAQIRDALANFDEATLAERRQSIHTL